MNKFLPVQINDKYNSSLSSINARLEQKCKEFFERRRIQKNSNKKKEKNLTLH